MVFCLVYDDVGCPELLHIVRVNDGEADNTVLLKYLFEKVLLVSPNKVVFVRFVARVNPGEGEGGLQVHLEKGF